MTMRRVVTDADIHEMLEQADYFHDAIVRECAVVARGYVDSDFRMFGDTEPFDVRVLIQSQSPESPGIELVFEGVERLCLGSPVDLEPAGEVCGKTVRFYFLRVPDKEPDVIASGLSYRLLDARCLGRTAALARPRPDRP